MRAEDLGGFLGKIKDMNLDFYVYSKSVDLGKTENYESKAMQWLDNYIIQKPSDIGMKSFVLQANTVEIHDE